MLLPFFYLYVRQLYTAKHLSSMDPAQAPVEVAAATASRCQLISVQNYLKFVTDPSKILNLNFLLPQHL